MPDTTYTPTRERGFKAGDPCGACGSTDTFEDYPGCFECGTCHRRDDDE